MKGRFTQGLRWSVAMCAAALLIGCGGNGTGSELPDPNVFFVNGSADAGNLRLQFNEDVSDGPRGYLETSPDFFPIEFKTETEEGYDVALATPDLSEIFDLDARVFERNSDTIILALGQRNFAAGEEAKRLRTLFLNVNRAPVGANSARLIIVQGFNRGPGNQTPNVDFKNPGDNPEFRVANLGFLNNGEVTIDAGRPFTWVIQRSDTEAIYATTTVTLSAGTFLVLLSGTEGATDPAQQPRITFIPLTTRL